MENRHSGEEVVRHIKLGMKRPVVRLAREQSQTFVKSSIVGSALRLEAQVPFAAEKGVVSAFLEQLGERSDVEVCLVSSVNNAEVIY